MLGNAGQEGLDDKTFPTATYNRMAKKIVKKFKTKKGMEQAAISDVNFGGFDKSFFDVGMIGG